MKETNEFNNISTATTTVVRVARGTLKRIILNEPTTGAVTVFDNTAAAGATIATIATGTAAQSLDYDCVFGNGLTILTAMADDVTVVFNSD